MKIRIMQNLMLKSNLNKDKKQQLLIQIRAYFNNSNVKFTVNPKDIDNSNIYIFKDSKQKNRVNNDPKSIRINFLINEYNQLIEKEINFQIKNYGTINTDFLKQNVFNNLKNSFEEKLFEFLKNQNMILLPELSSSGNAFRVSEEINKMEFKEAITIDADGDFVEIDNLQNEIAKVNYQIEINKEIEANKISKLDTQTRYLKGYFDSNNIFELFASIKYDSEISSIYNKLIFRLFQYRYFEKPTEKLKDLNEDWVFNFLKYLSDFGYSTASSNTFDPLKFDENTFVNKPFLKYNPRQIKKLFEIFKTVYNYLNDKYQLPQINFRKIKIDSIVDKKIKVDGMRINHCLNYLELNQLYNFKFLAKDNDYYNLVFKELFKSKINLTLTTDNFNTAKDLFLIQIMGGGLRGFRDLQTSSFSQKENTISFNAAKTNDLIINPLNEFTEPIAVKYDYQLPFLDIIRKDNGKQVSENLKEFIYRAIIGVIGEVLNFDRKINVENKLVELKTIIKPYFARKTFSQILYDNFQFSIEEVSIFTGHYIGSSELVKSYIDTSSIERKKELSKKIIRA